MRFRSWIGGGLIASAVSITAGAAQAAAIEICPNAPLQTVSLPHLKQALERNKQVIIVSIGSSSTEGWMSSDIGKSYPALLQQMLSKAWPDSHVAVINRGIGGQDAAEELPRLHPDALAMRPQLVIWQVGANGALRDTDLRVFRKLLLAGLTMLDSADTDVILMDNQRAPALLATEDDNQIDRSLAELAHQNHVSLFSRSLLMDEWREKGVPYKNFIAVDGLHHNDLGYRCVAASLTASIVKEVGPVVVDKTKLWR